MQSGPLKILAKTFYFRVKWCSCSTMCPISSLAYLQPLKYCFIAHVTLRHCSSFISVVFENLERVLDSEHHLSVSEMFRPQIEHFGLYGISSADFSLKYLIETALDIVDVISPAKIYSR